MRRKWKNDYQVVDESNEDEYDKGDARYYGDEEDEEHQEHEVNAEDEEDESDNEDEEDENR